eukprot:1195115-Prorocentrum_minimum.AAC.2
MGSPPSITISPSSLKSLLHTSAYPSSLAAPKGRGPNGRPSNRWGVGGVRWSESVSNAIESTDPDIGLPPSAGTVHHRPRSQYTCMSTSDEYSTVQYSTSLEQGRCPSAPTLNY